MRERQMCQGNHLNHTLTTSAKWTNIFPCLTAQNKQRYPCRNSKTNPITTAELISLHPPTLFSHQYHPYLQSVFTTKTHTGNFSAAHAFHHQSSQAELQPAFSDPQICPFYPPKPALFRFLNARWRQFPRHGI